jgi:putative selenium metabolism protein SsnA
MLGHSDVGGGLPLIVGNGIVTDGSSLLIDQGAVLIQGARIERIGPLDEMPRAGASFVDVGGRIVMPGLLNAHHHLYSSLATGLKPLGPTPDFVSILGNLWWSLDLALDEESIYYSALFGIIESIKHGVTMIFDHHASMGCVRGSLALVAGAFRAGGIKGLLCLETSDRMGIDAVGEQIEENLAGLSDPAASNTIRYAFGLHANFTLSNATLERVAAAKPTDMPIHIHCGEDRADLDFCLANGFHGPVERLHRFGLLGSDSLLAHAIHLTDADYRLIDEVHPVIVSNPESNANNRVGTMNRQRVGEYVLGTDGMSPDMVETLRSHYLLNAVPFVELRSAFFDRRYALQQRFFPDTGSLAPGARADIAVLDYAPSTPIRLDNLVGHLIFGARAGKVYMTVADGKILYRDGEVTFVDAHDLRRNVKWAARNLHERYHDGRAFSQR